MISLQLSTIIVVVVSQYTLASTRFVLAVGRYMHTVCLL
jgi:hypothetical protein